MLSLEILSQLEDYQNPIIITDQSNKKAIESYYSNKPLLENYSVLTINDLAKKLLITIKEEAILVLMENGYNIFYAKKLLTSVTLYLNNECKNITKEHFEEITKVITLITPYIIYPNINNFKIYLEGKTLIDLVEHDLPIYELLLKVLEKNNLNIFKLNIPTSHLPYALYECGKVADEVDLVINNISKLIIKNVNLSDIMVIYNDTAYLSELERVFNQFNIPYEVDKSVPLSSFDQIKTLIETIKSSDIQSFKDISSYLASLVDIASLDDSIQNVVVNIFNHYITYPINKYVKDLIIEELKDTKVYLQNEYGIKLYSTYDLITDVKYAFIMGASSTKIPLKPILNEYLTDDEIESITGYKFSVALKKEEQALINLINSCYVTFSYSKVLGGYKVVKSYFFDQKETPYQLSSDIIYNKDYSFMNYLKAEEDHRLYGIKSDIYLNHDEFFRGVTHNDYDFTFDGIDDEVRNKYNECLELSFSSLDDLFTCPFKYYMNKFFKIYEDSYKIQIGNYFHHVLEQLHKKKVTTNIEEEIKTISKDYFEKHESFDKDSIVYQEIYAHYLYLIYTFSLDFFKTSSFKVMACEYRISFEQIINGIKVRIKGFLDQVLQYGDYYLVLDYKTGKPKLDFERIELGLNLQLPFYFYLLRNEFKDSKFAGAFLEHILPTKPFKHDDNKTYDEQYKKMLCLEGIVNDSDDIQNHINSIGKNTYFNANSKKSGKLSFSDDEIDILINYVSTKVEEAVNIISNGNFEIRPYEFGLTERSCTYCKYRSVCYRPNRILKHPNLDKDLGFLFNKEDEENE